MAAAVAAPAIAPAEGLPLSDTSVDGELVKVDVGAHVEHRSGEVADGDFENTTPCLVTVTSELFGIVCVTPESVSLAGEGEGEGAGAGEGDEDEDEDDKEEEASGDSIVLIRVRAVEVVAGIWLQKTQGEHE
ncbi:hypothetical protein E4U61_005171 [Claviceps capensis]|nr:hypothetical protein E4U61_005171 [Claviceps capensis]